MYLKYFEKVQVCIETGRTFIVIVRCNFWSVTHKHTQDYLIRSLVKVSSFSLIFI